MLEFVRQQYRGQTFATAFADTVSPVILASGYSERYPNYEGRFWWGLLEDSEGNIHISCGYVSNFRRGGWDYKITFLDQWSKVPIPPRNMRNAIGKHQDGIVNWHYYGIPQT